MATILSCLGKKPQFGSSCFVAPNATVIGDVIMGDECSVWFNAVVRGDVNFIRLGNRVNIQDGVIIHCTFEKNATEIGDNVSIGHNAIVHGCIIKNDVLIGMGAIIMDRCIVNSNSVIAAGAVVLEGTVIESNSIYAGVPAKKVKELSKDGLHNEIERIAKNYVKYSLWFSEVNAANQ